MGSSMLDPYEEFGDSPPSGGSPYNYVNQECLET
jgi:hypothetical protein